MRRQPTERGVLVSRGSQVMYEWDGRVVNGRVPMGGITTTVELLCAALPAHALHSPAQSCHKRAQSASALEISPRTAVPPDAASQGCYD